MLQAPADRVPGLVPAADELSMTPSVRLRGVPVHSGDLLVSRGGAPTSALIARATTRPRRISNMTRVIAEWRDPNVLFGDHLDNAIIDALLDTTAEAEPLPYRHSLLPMARAVKLYSMVKNLAGSAGPVPEGMTATAALHNQAFTERHGEIKAELLRRERTFRAHEGYVAPYWVLVELAKGIIHEG